MAERKSTATLDQLSDEQREAVFEHCESITLALGIAWLRDEWDIELKKTALGEWLAKMRADKDFQKLLSRIRSDAERAELVGKTLGDAGNMTEANVALISQAVFEEMLKPEKDRDIKKIFLLMAPTQKAGDQKLKSRKLDHEVEKFKASLRTKLETGLEALAQEIQGNERALAKYKELKEALAPA